MAGPPSPSQSAFRTWHAAPHRLAVRPAVCTLAMNHTLLRIVTLEEFAAAARRGFPPSNSLTTRFIRSAASPAGSPLAEITSRIAASAACRSSAAGGSSAGIAASAASSSISSMKNCSRTIALNCDQRQLLVVGGSQPHLADQLEAPLVDRLPRHADMERAAHYGFAKAALVDMRAKLRDPGLHQLAMQRAGRSLAQVAFRVAGLNSASRLQHRRAVDGEKGALGHLLGRLTP